MKKKRLIWMVCLLLGLGAGAQDFNASRISFATAEKFILRTPAGEKTSIGQPQKPLCLFVFLSPECPLCKNYSLVLNALFQKWAPQVQVYGIVPGRAYEGAEIEKFKADYNISFPLLIDSQKKLSLFLKAAVTPEVVLADAGGNIVYRGAIDDWVPELGKKKLQPQQHYLDDAIRSYLSGQPVAVKNTKAKGCLINEF